MGRIKKKGTSGAATNYITRTKAVRKLQISLPDFRRLCIFKGIYPREPRSKKKVSKSATPSTTFYYTKDIQYLLHEPLLQKFRDHKTLAKKVARALGRGEASDAARLERNHTPRIALDHVIKERYPTFVDALRDLDDALSMLFLFANLPSTSSIPPKTIALCQRLCHEFQHYLIVSHSLRKSFLSIKGIYYQATIQGQDILWLVPYKFVQRVSGDIDFRIMGTFIEFYTTLLAFVNFRLFTSIGLVYPPEFDAKSDDKGGELGAFTLQQRSIESGPAPKQIGQGSAVNGLASHDSGSLATERAQAAANALQSSAAQDSLDDPADEAGPPDQEDPESTTVTAIDTFPASSSRGADSLPQPGPSTNEAAALFSDFTFFLSRETPRQPLEFLLKAFGCKRVGWDAVLGDGAYTTDELDSTITHQIVDKPPLVPTSSSEDDPPQNGDDALAKAPVRGRVPGRTYIQPQWVWDCVNVCQLLRPDLYAPGATLPPHLSPWVKPSRGEYDPTAPLPPSDEAATLSSATALPGALPDGESDEDEEESGSGDFDDDDEEEEEDDDENEPALALQTTADETNDWAGFSSSGEDDNAEDTVEDAAAQHSLELEAGTAAAASAKSKPLKSALKKPTTQAERAAREKHEQLERQKMMMSRRKRKLFEKMEFGNKKRSDERDRLVAKRRRIEGGSA